MIDTDSPGERLEMNMPDGYALKARRWGPATGGDAVLLLHGLLGHSGWFGALGEAFLARKGPTLVAPDRRGVGLNALEEKAIAGSDVPEMETLLQDVVAQVAQLRRSFDRVHLGGYSSGARGAIVALPRCRDLLQSLILVSPAFDMLPEPTRRSSLLVRMVERLGELNPGLDLEGEGRPFLPLWFGPSDITDDPRWRERLEGDAQRSEFISLRLLRILRQQARSVGDALANTRQLPTLLVRAERDRVVDGRSAAQRLAVWSGVRHLSLDAGHGVAFERAGELAAAIVAFVQDSLR